MMFHRRHDPVIVQSEAEEAALGAGWSRIIQQRDLEPAPAPSRDLPEIDLPPDEGPDPEPAEQPGEEQTPRRSPGRPKKAVLKRQV